MLVSHFAKLNVAQLNSTKASSQLNWGFYAAKAKITNLLVITIFFRYFPQYKWLEEEQPKVNQTETPWLIVLMNSPWYNSCNYHFLEGESMRVTYEAWFVKYKVDVVFASHTSCL